MLRPVAVALQILVPSVYPCTRALGSVGGRKACNRGKMIDSRRRRRRTEQAGVARLSGSSSESCHDYRVGRRMRTSLEARTRTIDTAIVSVGSCGDQVVRVKRHTYVRERYGIRV
jgi:hypothetical protein